MACGKTQKQKESGPLLLLLALFADMAATAELFRTVRWANGLFCPRCGGVDIVRYCRYQGHIRRYTCKGCRRTFNDKTGTILHYRHIRMGDWMLAVWMFLCGPPNGISINYIATSIGRAYGTVYRMMRDIMRKVGGLPEGKLSGTGETDEGYTRAGSKGVSLGSNGENRTIPSRRRLPRGPGRGTFKKNVPMVTIYHQRATGDEPDVTIFEVPRGNGRTLAEMVAGKFEPGSTVITDEHPAYKSLGEMGYGHLAINHSEGEYASGEHNDIHTNNCECRIGLLKWWLKKHRGVSKWHLERYVKSFQFVHNHRHYGINGRFVAALAAVLDQYPGMQA